MIARKVSRPIALMFLTGATHVWVALMFVALANAWKTALS
jgi:hypothetical protein